VPASHPTVLHDVTQSAIGNLRDHSVDRLEVEICLAMLEAAHELDTPSP